jgi:2-polyprenyl-3-methyl-5-hydroxy-6-metoxy-1,4-benzoquinol methylase
MRHRAIALHLITEQGVGDLEERVRERPDRDEFIDVVRVHYLLWAPWFSGADGDGEAQLRQSNGRVGGLNRAADHAVLRAMDNWTDNYDAFAHVYDRCWATRSCARFLDILDEHLLDAVDDGAHILDLCCGTGRLDERLCERGFEVHGIDNAPEMIALARVNAPSASFEVADARSFEVDRAYPLVVSTYDGLNHIPTVDELGQVFRRVYAALEPGGLFAFDMNTPHKHQNHWATTFTIDEDDFFLAVRAEYIDERREATFEGTLFVEGEGGLWRRQDFVLRERPYERETVCKLLAEAGFVGVEVVRLEVDEDGQPLRWLFRARRA